MRRPVDRSFHVTQRSRLTVWLLFDGDTSPFAEIHLNERSSRTRSPRLIEACVLLALAGDAYDFVEAIAMLQMPEADEVLTTLITRAREIVAKKEGFTL
ncbi:MAG: hypothetical protein WDN30_14345 [Pararobbsia sp.]